MHRELGLVLVYKQPSDIFQCRCLQHMYQEEFVVGVDRIFDGGGEGVLQTASTWLLDRPVWFDSMGSVVFWEHWKFFPDKRRISVGFLLACVPVRQDRWQWDCHLRSWQILLLTEVWSWSMFYVQQLTLNCGLLKLTSLQPYLVDKVRIGKCRCVVPVIRDLACVNSWDKFKCKDGVLAFFTIKLLNRLSMTFVLARICCANCATAFCWVGSKMTFCCWTTLLRPMLEPHGWGLPLPLSAILFV